MVSCCRDSARLALTVRIARIVPSSIAPSLPTCSWASSCALASFGIKIANRPATTTTAITVVPSRVRSSTPIKINVPASMIAPLIRPITLDAAASRNSTVSEVTRVTSSPGG